ncbi:MAG: alpha/beta hydrolase [Actinomycetota bacterium]
MISRVLANLATKPGNAPLFDDPANYDLAYQDVTFTAADGIGLSGWLINPGQNKVIIQNHFGIFCSRAGYTLEGKSRFVRAWPEDIPFLEHIKILADNGYTVLAYDLRNHGNSDQGTNPWICDRQEEYKDVIAAVRFMSEHDDYRSAPIGLLSICMGSSSTVLNYGIADGLQTFPDVRAMVAVQPLYSGAWFRNWNIPGFIFDRSAEYSVKRGGIDYRKSPADHWKRVTVPTMIIQNNNDPIGERSYVEECYTNLPTDKEMVWTGIEKSRLAAYADLARDPDKMLEWFSKHV